VSLFSKQDGNSHKTKNPSPSNPKEKMTHFLMYVEPFN
jgi:hypothetical protein